MDHSITATCEVTAKVKTPATCAAEGVTTYTATYDDLSESKDVAHIEKLAHVPGEAVMENVVASTTTAAGSYDKVVYCKECKAELSREKVVTPILTPATPVVSVGDTIAATGKNAGKYKVTKLAKNGSKPEVTFVSPASKKQKTVTVPTAVTIDGVSYKVTKIAANAFAHNKKLTKIVIKSKKLTAKSIGKNAFKNISSKVVIDVPNKKVKQYKKLFQKKGLSKKVVIK